MSTALVLFRRDLRLTDNPALSAACAAHDRVLTLYIHDLEHESPWLPGAASRWWLHHSLQSLQDALRACGGRLHLAQGDSLQELPRWIEQSDAQFVYWNRRHDARSIARDQLLQTTLQSRGVQVQSHAATLWSEPSQIQTQQGAPYRVFTPFWRNLRAQLGQLPPLEVAAPTHWVTLPDPLSLDRLDLLPRVGWDAGLQQAWQPGEQGARDLLDLFCDDAINDYAHGRDMPGRHGTSRLSPHLHFGEISPRQIHHRLRQHADRVDARRRPDIEPFLRELGWREFAHHLLYHFPHTSEANFNPRFDDFPWAPLDEVLLQRWQQGRSGIPLVDAGMRELWHTGWMHNRVRMIVGSFLTKNLRQHWQHGALWFWDTLVDADLANNSLGWQWVAGCGADAAPYFRVFNPVTQAKRFDPDGVYLRRWLPELRDAPLPLLHEPWKDPLLLRRCGYPAPIVDLGRSRQQALDAYASFAKTGA